MAIVNKRGIQLIISVVQHYNHERYWKYREKVINPNCKVWTILKVLMLFYIKRCDAFNNASMGTDLNYGAYFKTPPHLPHGLNGIIVNHRAVFGENCTIFQQVTVGVGSDGRVPTFGDNVIIGAGARVIGGCKIGNNVSIGAGTVVTKDVPDNSTVVGASCRILPKIIKNLE